MAELPNDVELVFHYHKGASKEVIQLVEDYNWRFGSKRIIQNTENIGLENSLLHCGGLSKEYEAVIILEDDLVVGKWFYRFALNAIQMANQLENVGGIGLYKHSFNPITGYKQHFIQHENGFVLLKKAITWGQVFTKKQWENFEEWKDKKSDFQLESPTYMNHYGADNWELQFNAYLHASKKYFLIPNKAHTSNSGLKGTHHNSSLDSGVFHVELDQSFHFQELNTKSNPIQFNPHFEIEYTSLLSLLPENHPLNGHNFKCDLNGSLRKEEMEDGLWLTTRKTTQPIMTFGLSTKPAEHSVIMGLEGNDIALTQKENIDFSSSAENARKAKYYFGNSVNIDAKSWLKFKSLSLVDRKKPK